MGKHAQLAEQISAMSERHRYDIGELGRGMHAVQLITTHVIQPFDGGVATLVETELDRPPVRPGRLWAIWTGQRMVRRAYRRDVRQKQPWTLPA